MKQRIIEKKTEEMQEYMGQVKSLLSMYVPPDPQKMGQTFQAGNASLNPQAADIVFKNYAQPGDQMTLSFNAATKKISAVNVNTYMDWQFRWLACPMALTMCSSRFLTQLPRSSR
jgi:hypothetical protein